MPYCVVKHCKNSSGLLKKDTGYSFHKFPREPDLQRKWIDVIRKNRDDDKWSPSPYCIVCSEHFQESDFYVTQTGRRRLSKKSIPTKNLVFTVLNCPIDISSAFLKYLESIKSTSHTKESISDQPGSPSRSESRTPTPSNTDAPTPSRVDVVTPFGLDPESDESAEKYSGNESMDESDTDPFDNSRKNILKKELKKYQILGKATKKKLKCLQQKVRRLNKRNVLLTATLKELEKNDKAARKVKDELKQEVEQDLPVSKPKSPN